jgi:hypothetical protein
MDKADSAGTVLFYLKSRDWSDEVLAVPDIPRTWMPKTFEGHEFTGSINIADLVRSNEIQSVHLAEALQYRPKLMMSDAWDPCARLCFIRVAVLRAHCNAHVGGEYTPA